MQKDNEAGDALDNVHRIHPVVERLRTLLQSAAALDRKAAGPGYWSEHAGEGERAMTSP